MAEMPENKAARARSSQRENAAQACVPEAEFAGREVAEEAPSGPPLGRAVTLGALLDHSFASVPQTIPGVLPTGGFLLVTAPAKAGKTWLMMQQSLALASGNCEFLGEQYADPLRVLFVQVEMTDEQVRDRFERLLVSPPGGINPEGCRRNLLVVTIAGCGHRLNLTEQRSLDLLVEIVQDVRPHVVVLDGFGPLHPGIDENSAQFVGGALGNIRAVADIAGASVILSHHHNKGNQYRGSTVLSAFPDTMISFAETRRTEAGDLVRLDGVFRHRGDPGPVWWRKPDDSDPWFRVTDPPPGGDSPTGGTQAKVIPPLRVAEICAQAGANGFAYRELIEAICEAENVGVSKAKDAARDARKAGTLVQQGKPWFPAQPTAVPEKGKAA